MTELIEVNVANLSGPALDWAVAKIDEVKTIMLAPKSEAVKMPYALFGSLALPIGNSEEGYAPSTCWHCGGPLFDKYQGSAHHEQHLPLATSYSAGISGSGFWCYGPTALVAFCRSLVKTKLGDTVQVPKELI